MEKIFYTRGKGRVRKSLDVYSDGEQYRFLFTTLDRTNPSKSERAAGAKEKRFTALEEEFYVEHTALIVPAEYPQPELVQKFVDFLTGDTAREANSN
ncbi:TPA: hypothetical protein MX214_004699 [Citrobacter sedlakii]|nr:hypothetical protein [Citrobacter sedlakii]HCA7137915.1 hypothetical protein [Citrobacter sedlakii]HCA7184049.1 hypothetical protein [Citrobacter sedlakii]